jgi:uncharacterized protein
VINELHHANSNYDTDEFVEFVFRQNPGVSPASIGGLVLYDGVMGESTRAFTAADALLKFDENDSNIGWSTELADSGPAGFALVDGCNTVVQFMSYGGSFQAKEGVANNMMSTDIRYKQSGDTAVGFSLQRIGIGYNQTQTDNNWVLAKQTISAPNAFQTFGTCHEVRVNCATLLALTILKQDHQQDCYPNERDSLQHLVL